MKKKISVLHQTLLAEEGFFQKPPWGWGVENLTPDLAYLEIGLEELSRAVNPGVNDPESERDAPSGT